MSQTKTKIFQKLSFGNYWTLSQDSETRLENPWNKSYSTVSGEDLTVGNQYTVCVKDLNEKNENSVQPSTDNFANKESDTKKNKIQSSFQSFQLNEEDKGTQYSILAGFLQSLSLPSS